MVHELKVWKKYFEQIKNRTKTYELRKNDRGFHPGDHLWLRDYDFNSAGYSGDYLIVRVLSVLEDAPDFGLQHGYCIMAIKEVSRK